VGLTVKNLICHVRVTLPAETVESGRPLDVTTLSRLEGLLGDQFDDVRIHTDAGAGARARGLGADAFITGKDIYFGPGRFETVTGRGLGLLAHELVHRRQLEDGTAGGDPEKQAMKAEREAAASRRPQETVYLETDTPEPPDDTATATAEKKPRETRRAQPPTAPPPGPRDIEQLLAAKVLALMRSEIVTERERRGLINPSGGGVPL
jgi:Domain of unknown function (DUF4157)